MNTLNRLSFSLLLWSLGSLTACSSGGGSGGGGGIAGGGAPGPLNPPQADLNVSFTVTDETKTASGVCAGEVGVVETYDIDIAQAGNVLTVTTPDGVFTGSISGDQIQWTGQFPEDGGTTTITSMSLTATNDTFSGTVNWNWTDGVDFCTGTSMINAVRKMPASAQPASILFALSSQTEQDLAVLAAPHGQPWEQAEVISRFDDGVSALLELAPGRWDIAIAVFDPELAEDPTSMQMVEGFRDMELSAGDEKVLVIDRND